MRNLTCKFGAICLMAIFCIATNAQEMITVSKNSAMTQQNVSTLNGKASVVFLANTNDMVITSSIKQDPQSPKAIKVGNQYRYEMVIDISGSSRRDFTVAKYGTTNSYEIKQTKLNSNEQIYFNIDQVENGIDVKKSTGNWIDTCAKKGEALIVFNSKIKLKISCPNLKLKNNIIRHGRSVAGTYLDSLIIDTEQFKELASQEDSLSRELRRAQRRLGRDDVVDLVDSIYNALDTLVREMPGKINKVSYQLADLLKIEVSGEKTNKIIIDYNDIKNLRPKDLLQYNIVILNETKVVEKEVMKEYSFDELLAQAKERYQEYPKHTDFAFYEGAMTTYKNVMSHKDCPDAMRSALKAEYDSITSIRRLVNFYERAGKIASESERGSQNELTYLKAQLVFIQQLLEYHPEIVGFNSIHRSLKEQIELTEANRSQPNKTKAPAKRQRVSGKISFANELLKRPFSSLQVYGSSTEKVDRKSSSRIGSVNDDGSYSVLIPDYTRYIYVTGEKKAHYIGDGRDKLDIEIR